jgi:hypothetical protein
LADPIRHETPRNLESSGIAYQQAGEARGSGYEACCEVAGGVRPGLSCSNIEKGRSGEFLAHDPNRLAVMIKAQRMAP